MKISVKNFGPIKQAKNIEIKPLTVFAGPSNTGKSYLATLIYSLINGISCFYDVDQNKRDYKLEKYFYTWLQGENKEIPNHTKLKIQDFIFPIIIECYKQSCEKEIIRCFGEEGKILLDKNNGLEIILRDNENKNLLNITSPNNSKISGIKKSFDSGLMNIRKEYEKNKGDSFHLNYFGIFTAGFMFNTRNNIYAPYKECPRYLPAGRGTVIQTYRALSAGAVRQASSMGLTRQSSPMFNGILAGFLESLIWLEPDRRQHFVGAPSNMNLSKIEHYLEKSVLGGKINIEAMETQYPDFRYSFANGKDKGRDIPLMQASSMVSELAPLSLFIRHYLQEDGMLIFEEPEAHLHPEAQRAISEVIVMLVKAGVCVIITTHSDYIIEQLGNFIHASGIPKDTNINLLGKDIAKRALNPEQVALYDFERKKTGTYVARVPYDPESGIIPKEHDKVLGALHNETVDLLNARNGDE